MIRWLLLATFTASAAHAAEPVVIVPVMPERGAESPERARAAYDAAAKSFYAGRVEAALPHAQAAFQALPNTSSALIVATILAELGRPCDALPYVLLAADLDPVGGEVQLVRALLHEQAPRCAPGYGWVRLTVQPEGAQLRLADVVVPAARTLAVVAGEHGLQAAAPGHQARNQTFVVAAGAAAELDVTLEPEPVVVVPVETPIIITPTPPPQRDDTLGWVVVGGGVAALVAGGICLGVAVDEANNGRRIVDAAATPPSPSDERRLATSHARTEDFEVAAWISGGVGLVAVTLGIVWLAAGDDAPVAWRPGLHIDARGGALSVEHRF